MTPEEKAEDPGFNHRLWSFIAESLHGRPGDPPEAAEFAHFLAGVALGLLAHLYMARQGLSEAEALAAAEERIRAQATLYGTLAAGEAPPR